MKNHIKNSVILVTALLLMGAAAFAVPPAISMFAGTGTDVGTTLCYAVVSANGSSGDTAVVTYLNATSDLGGSVIKFYTVTDPARATGANTTVTLAVAATNTAAWADGGIVVIRHMATDTYERRILAAPWSTATTNLKLTAAPTTTMAAGDLIYLGTAAGTIPVGAATKELTGDGIYCGQRGKPLLVEIDGTSLCQINAVCAKYVK
jgi:hypothetical protein